MQENLQSSLLREFVKKLETPCCSEQFLSKKTYLFFTTFSTAVLRNGKLRPGSLGGANRQVLQLGDSWIVD